MKHKKIRNPKSKTRNPKPETTGVHPSSFILHPPSFILHPSSFILHPSSFHDFLWIFLFSFILRLVLIIKSPWIYSFDGYLFLMGLSSQYPLFTGFIKILISCGISLFMIRITIAVIASAACFAFYLFVHALFKDNGLARVATFMMSIYPSFVVFSLVPYTEPLFLLMLFTGLWFFIKERDAESAYYPKTGLFLGLACLTRYEAVLILPLIFIAILIRNRKNRISQFSIFNFQFSISLFWAPVALILYNYAVTPELATSQSEETQNIFKELFPILEGMIDAGLPNMMKEIRVRGLQFPLWVFIVGCAFATVGCIIAIIKDKKHLLFVIFIIMAAAIQLLPIASNCRDYPGRIIGLRRHGMIPALFLILYLSYGFDMLVKILPFRRKIWQVAVLLILAAIPAAASFKTTAYLINDFQKLYRGSFIEPCWIGKPSDAGSGIITAVSNRILMLRLQGTGLPLYPYEQLNFVPKQGVGNKNQRYRAAAWERHNLNKELEDFIRKNQIKYVFIERYSFSEFDNLFMKKHAHMGFRKLADVGGWLFVYARET